MKPRNMEFTVKDVDPDKNAKDPRFPKNFNVDVNSRSLISF